MNLAINQIYHYPSQQEPMFNFALPYLAENEEQAFSHQVVAELYSKKKMRGDYTAVLNWNFKNENQIILFESTFDSKYDIYLPPLVVNQRHSVMKHLIKTSGIAHSVMLDLLSHLELNPKLRPQLGIYQNNIIAKTEVYRDYAKNYLKPAIKFLNKKCDNENIIALILDMLWSIYYDVNKDKLTCKILKKNIIEGKYLFSIVDLDADSAIDLDDLKTFPYPTTVLKYQNNDFEFHTNTTINKTIDTNKYVSIYQSITDEHIRRLTINQVFYEDLFMNNYSNYDYEFLIYSDSINTFKHDIEHIDFKDESFTLFNLLCVKQFENNTQWYGKFNIMYMFYMLIDEYKSISKLGNLDSGISRILGKKGIKILEK